MMTLPDIAAVFAAAHDGKEIQWSPDPKGPWEFIDASPRVLTKAVIDDNFLRVKPVAREWWLSTYPNGDPNHVLDCEQRAIEISVNKKAIHVREVID
jgi:hypothetical protein